MVIQEKISECSTWNYGLPTLPSCWFIFINMCHARQRLGDGEPLFILSPGSEEKECARATGALSRSRSLSLCHTRSSSSTLLIDRFTSNKSKDVNKKIRQYTGNLVIFPQLWSWLVLKKNRESSMSETETRPRPNAVESETRPRPSKSGLETKTGLEYYNTTFRFRLRLLVFNLTQ